MGQKHRNRRKADKRVLGVIDRLAPGWRENEFGELTHVGTKAEARRQLIRRRIQLPSNILEMAKADLKRIFRLQYEKALADTLAEEDARVFQSLNRAIEATT